jgi:hypothetical protein
MKTPKKMSRKMGPFSKKTKMMATPKKKGMPGKGKTKTPMGGGEIWSWREEDGPSDDGQMSYQ